MGCRYVLNLRLYLNGMQGRSLPERYDSVQLRIEPILDLSLQHAQSSYTKTRLRLWQIACSSPVMASVAALHTCAVQDYEEQFVVLRPIIN